jgi:coatomer subunit gamma
VIDWSEAYLTVWIFSFTGIYRGGAEVLVRAKLALADGVTMQLTVRSTDPDVAELVTSAVG